MPKLKTAPRLTYSSILIVLSIMLLILPFVTTFNEFLTKLVETSQLYRLIQAYFVPFLVRLVALILGPFGIHPQVTNDSLVMIKNGKPLLIYLSWNCLGWQSFILFLLTLITGLQGNYRVASKITCILAGLLGTFWINIIRIAIITIMAYWLGQAPAILFHDYFSTLLTIGWLLMFWKLSFTYILE